MRSADLDLVTTKIGEQKASQKVRILILLLAIISDEQNPNILTSKLCKVTKSAISPQSLTKPSLAEGRAELENIKKDIIRAI